jgi:hypothetical protein
MILRWTNTSCCAAEVGRYDVEGNTRPRCITNVFDARELRSDQVSRGIKSGIASSVRAELWTAAEIYPNPVNSLLQISPAQASALALFGP